MGTALRLESIAKDEISSEPLSNLSLVTCIMTRDEPNHWTVQHHIVHLTVASTRG